MKFKVIIKRELIELKGVGNACLVARLYKATLVYNSYMTALFCNVRDDFSGGGMEDIEKSVCRA